MLKKFIFLFFIGLSGFTVKAQITYSPYSRFGLGEILDPGSTRNFSMGGTGFALYDPAIINRMNPASYGDLKLTSFDFNGYLGSRLLRTNTSSRIAGTGGLHNVSFGFSSRKNFGLVFGLAPYSASNYVIVTRDTLQTDSLTPYKTTYEASGGLNQFYLGAGIRIFNKLNLGLNAEYGFGSTNYKWETNFENPNFSVVTIKHRVSLNGFIPQAGFQFGDTLRVNTTVNLTEELTKQEKKLDKELKYLKGKENKIQKSADKLNAKNASKEAKKAELKRETEMLQPQLDKFMQEERLHEKEIGKLQEKKYKLEKKQKKIDQKIKKGEREINQVKALNKNLQDNLVKQKNQIATKRNEIAEGKRDKIATKVNKLLVRIGGVYQPGIGMNGTRLVMFDNSQIFDTLGTELRQKVGLPMKLGGGISIGAPYKWTLTADVAFQDWSSFNYFDEPNYLTNSMRISVGGEYIPKLFSIRYTDRFSWRAGAWFEKTSIVIGDQPIRDYGFSLGVGLPLGRPMYPGAFSRLNLGIVFGNRGTTKNNLLQENYIMFRLGLNLTDVWFLRSRID